MSTSSRLVCSSRSESANCGLALSVAGPTVITSSLLPQGESKMHRRRSSLSWSAIVIIAAGVAGPTRVEAISGAGHLADLDEPEACAQLVLEFLG